MVHDGVQNTDRVILRVPLSLLICIRLFFGGNYKIAIFYQKSNSYSFEYQKNSYYFY